MEKKYVKLENNETYAYIEQGSGDKNLLLIHGNFSSSLYYMPLLERMPKDIHVVAMDMRGFGDSSYEQRIHSLKDFAKDISLFMKALAIQQAVVVGWSLGGGVAMELAAHYPSLVSKLVLINSTTHKGYPVFKKDDKGQMIFGSAYQDADEMATDPIQVKPLLQALAAKNLDFLKYIYDITIYTVNKPTPEANQIYITESLKQRNLADADFALATQNMGEMPSAYHPGENTISRIQVPVLHFWGTKDITVPEMMVLGNIEALKEQSTYIRFEDCGHSPLVDKPDELTQNILDFMK